MHKEITEEDIFFLKDYLYQILIGFLGEEDEIQIDHVIDSYGLLYTVRVRESAMPVVVGKGGERASALRALLKGAAYKRGVRASVRTYDYKPNRP